ncbi:metallophosphoesterase [Halorarius litoreus]|uniref:metallophosphoesterase n=1 Tax=Halorarius litoreus TaxID=2962676 RepID=UPI0020CD56D3|nr:metallophosphoesterase [Halorarius litoreus]
MTRYLISDHHFDHNNIIEYCDRPFTSVGQMHDTMLSRFHEVVDPGDTLYHLGDVAMAMRDPALTGEWLSRLSESAVLVRGNHDAALDPESVDYPVVQACVLETEDRRFYCTHRPEHTPGWWDGWVLHGHHHNNHPEEFPLVRTDTKRVNVGAELLDYRPASLPAIDRLLDACERQGRRLVRDRSAAEAVLADAQAE